MLTANRLGIIAWGCGLLVLVSVVAFLLVLSNAALFQVVNTWYDALPQTNYVELVQDAFRPNILVSNFAAHMMIMTANFAVLGVLLGWYLCYWRPCHGTAGTEKRTLAGTLLNVTLFVLAGSAILAFTLACFISVPGSAGVCALYAKEGVVDFSHNIGFLSTACLLWIAAWRYARRRQNLPGNGFIALGAALAGAVAFVLGMEEISWGQTYLAWQSPAFFVTYNGQQETNAHNFVNGYLTPIYYALGMAILVGTIVAYVLDDLFGGKVAWARTLCPPRALLWVAIWFPLGSEIFIFSSTEVFESLLTIYALGYGVAILARSSTACATRTALSPQGSVGELWPTSTPAAAPSRSAEVIVTAAGNR